MKVFISYSHDDIKIAKEIVSVLKQNKIDFFMDNEDINIGEDILKKVDNELFKEATHLITIISPSSIESQWVSYEIATAKATNKVILPYITHKGLIKSIPFFIKSLKWTAEMKDFDDYFKKISTTNPFNLEINLKLAYGGYKNVNEQMIVWEDGFFGEEVVDIKTKMATTPILELCLINKSSHTVEVNHPTIHFRKLVDLPFAQKGIAISFGPITSSIRIPPKSTHNFLLWGVVLMSFYKAIQINAVESIQFGGDNNEPIQYRFDNVNEIKTLFNKYYSNDEMKLIHERILNEK